MVVLDRHKEELLTALQMTPGATLGGSDAIRIDADNYWSRLVMKVTLGTLSGGSSPAWAADAGDRLIKELTVNLGGSLNLITRTSVVDLKRFTQLEFGEEVMADGYMAFDFFGQFPAFLYENGITFKPTYETLANLTTGSPTSQAGTKIEWYLRKFPIQGKPPRPVGFPIIKTEAKDLPSLTGRKQVVNLNSGNLLRHLLIKPSSGTLITDVELSLADGEDVLYAHDWTTLRELNKLQYYFDAREAAGGYAAYTFGPSPLPTDKAVLGQKLDLYATVVSEASGKITVVTFEHMTPPAEAFLLQKIAPK